MRRLYFGICFIALLACGCEHAPPFTGPEGGVEAKLSSIQTHIFNRSCALQGCHIGGASAPYGLDLSEGQAYGNLVGVQAGQSALNRVEPNDPDNSFLIIKLENGTGIVGDPMPRFRAPLPAQEIQAIRDWISNGAPND